MKNNLTEKEIKILFPESEIEIAGLTFSVRPFSFVESKRVVEKLGSVIHLLGGDITPEVLGQLYASAFEQVRDIIAMVLKIEPTIVEQLDLGSISKIVMEIIRVNKDFFDGSVKSNLEGIAEIFKSLDQIN
jgi:hypothetical protein